MIHLKHSASPRRVQYLFFMAALKRAGQGGPLRHAATPRKAQAPRKGKVGGLPQVAGCGALEAIVGPVVGTFRGTGLSLRGKGPFIYDNGIYGFCKTITAGRTIQKNKLVAF